MSECTVCGGLYMSGPGITCSTECHTALVEKMIAEFGEFKKVIRVSTGVAYKVPVKDIIELGIKEQELDKYPIWEE